MSPFRKIACAGAAFTLLAGCQNLPSTSGILSGFGTKTCPDFSRASGAYTPPFPASCETMQTTASGLRWIDLAPGLADKGTPKGDATVVVNYEGYLADSGKQIDSSYARGESSVFQLAELTDGMAEALQSMTPGAERIVFIPSALAYGDEARGDLIPANSDLVFRLKLEGFLSAAELAQAAGTPEPEASATASAKPTPVFETDEPLGPDMDGWAANFPWDPSAPGVNVLDSGVSYKVLTRGGSSSRNAILSDEVVVHYEGRLAETSDFFDSSWANGGPATFPVSGVIPGFTEVLTYMRPGDNVIVHIPAAMAYGDEARGDIITPNSDLMFQIFMLAIKPAS